MSAEMKGRDIDVNNKDKQHRKQVNDRQEMEDAPINKQ